MEHNATLCVKAASNSIRRSRLLFRSEFWSNFFKNYMGISMWIDCLFQLIQNSDRNSIDPKPQRHCRKVDCRILQIHNSVGIPHFHMMAKVSEFDLIPILELSKCYFVNLFDLNHSIQIRTVRLLPFGKLPFQVYEQNSM